MATKSKENTKGIQHLQEKLLQNKKDIKGSDLKSLGFDTTLKKFEIRNIKVEKDILFSDTYYLSIIDKQKDLDGKPIAENKNLIHRIHSLWEAGKKTILFKDILELKILPVASEIKIGNILLSNYLGVDKDYDISLINKEKNIDNKWLNLAVTKDRVIDVLTNFQYTPELFKLAKVPLNKELEKYFKEHFEIVKKSDASNAGDIDLTIGKDKSRIAIELKLSRQIKTADASQKCRGQIEDYKKQFGSSLILVIAGEKPDKQEKYVQLCIDKAHELGIKPYFLEVKK